MKETELPKTHPNPPEGRELDMSFPLVTFNDISGSCQLKFICTKAYCSGFANHGCSEDNEVTCRGCIKMCFPAF